MDIVQERVAWVEIRVGSDRVAKVDANDFPLVAGRTWFTCTNDQCTYAGSNVLNGEKTATVMMHRLIAVAGRESEVDHENGDGLDNRRFNLRICTHAENMRNRRKHKPASSRFKGVWFDKRHGKWTSEIKVGGKKIYGGRFRVEEDAAKRYDELSLEHHGEFGRRNFP